MSRSYESNGPDVKVRGTASHVAEKYMQLARDAHASGDPVLAENYLQHAEHYFRIIAAAQAQQQPGGESPPHRYNGGGRYDSAEYDGDDGDEQETQRPAPEVAAKAPAETNAPQAEPEASPQAEQPAPRRRRRRNTGETATADNGADPSAAEASGPAGEASEPPRAGSEPRTEDAGKEDVSA